MLLVSLSIKAQWQNKSTHVSSALYVIKNLDSIYYLMGKNYLYRSADTGNTITRAGYDTVRTFYEVVKNKDTVYVFGSWLGFNYLAYTYFNFFKILPHTDTLYRGPQVEGGAGMRYNAINFKDSMIIVANVIASNGVDTSYINMASGLHTPNGVWGYNGAGWATRLVSSSRNVLRNFYLRDSTLFLISNYFYKENNTHTILTRRNVNRYYSRYDAIYQYDSVINLPNGKDIYMFNDSAGFIIGDTFIAKSNNYTDWTIKYTNPDCLFNKVWFTGKDTGYVVGSKNGKALILKTQDGGLTWKEQICPVTAPLNDIKFTADGRVGLIVGDSGTILRTTNGGGNQFVGLPNKQNPNDAGISMFPNPVRDGSLRVTTKQTTPVLLSIYNSLGALIYKSEITGEENIDVTGWANGCYALQYLHNGVSYSQKLIVNQN